jgi:hypothetical protein
LLCNTFINCIQDHGTCRSKYGTLLPTPVLVH